MKYIVGFLLVFFPSMVMAAAGDLASTQYKSIYPLPVDSDNKPLGENSLGLPLYSEAVTLSDGTYTSLIAVPSTGNNLGRVFRHLMVRNPDGTRVLYLCFGAGSCATNMLKVPPSTTVVLDGLFFGALNTVTGVWGKLDAAGTVVPEIAIW